MGEQKYHDRLPNLPFELTDEKTVAARHMDAVESMLQKARNIAQKYQDNKDT